MGLISPVSGRETDKIVAFGNSSKIHSASPHCLAEWDLGITPSDWTTPLAISLSVDISTTFFHANTNSSPFACDFGRDTIIKKKTHTQKRESLSCEEQERSFEGQRSGFYSFSESTKVLTWDMVKMALVTCCDTGFPCCLHMMETSVHSNCFYRLIEVLNKPILSKFLVK